MANVIGYTTRDEAYDYAGTHYEAGTWSVLSCGHLAPEAAMDTEITCGECGQ